MAEANAPLRAVTRRDTASRHSLRHIPELDGIRGLAALAVFGHHALTTFTRETLEGGWPIGIQRVSRFFEYANTGVDLFFVLSGFLITSILITERTSKTYYQDFYWKRALRILPLYILTLLGAWIYLRQTAYTFLALAFLVNFAGLLHLHLIEPGPFWSLGIEEQFYLIWPTLVRRLDVRRILRWSIGIGIACIVLRVLLGVRHHHDYQLSPLRCDGLAFGAALACYFYMAGDSQERRKRIVPLLIFLGVLGVVLVALAKGLNLHAFYQSTTQTGVVLITGPIVGLSVIFRGSPFLAPLRSRFLTFMGLISYAFYMVHIYVIMIYQHFRGPRLAPGDVFGYWMGAVITLTVSIAVALLSRYFIELPIMRLRKYVLKHPNTNAEQEHPPLPLARM
jgi:peptidoglycan/LPS O-acetylase OafA/YrhL